MKRSLLILLSLVFFTGTSRAIDKGALSHHLRSAFNIDLQAPIEILDIVPSEYPSLKKVPVMIGGRPYVVYVSDDEKRYIMGQSFELAVYPDTDRMSKIDLTNVHSQGSSKAPVTIVEYTDLQCPYCQKAHEILHDKLYKTYTKNQVRWVFKQYPLEGHDWSMNGALALECAGQQKEQAFWDMASYLFKGQKDTKKENFNEKLEKGIIDLKLDAAKLNACMSNESAKKKIEAEKAEGTELGVSATPTILVNGRMKTGIRDFESFKMLIDEKLKEAK